MEELTGRRIVRADGLSVDSLAAAIEPGVKDAGVVEDHQIAGPQEGGEVAEQAIGIVAAGPLQMQHARSVARGKGILGDEFVGKMEVEVGNQHEFRL